MLFKAYRFRRESDAEGHAEDEEKRENFHLRYGLLAREEI